MNLNTIELPDFIVREWYKDTLLTPPQPSPQAPPEISPTNPPVPPSSTKPAVPPTPVPSLKYLGSNRLHIILLVHAPDTPFLPDNQLAFLTKLLEACRLTLADVAIVNNAATPVTIVEVRLQLQPKTTLLFGLEPSALRLPINFPMFKPLDYDGCTYLSAPSLDQLLPNSEESKLLKSKLWVCLKTIFAV
jgi:hypothetical protein